MRMWRTSGGHPHACEGLWVVGSQLSGALAMVAVLLLPKQLGWQRATHKHQYPAWTSCVPASSPGCAAGTRQDLLTGLARALQALLKPTAPEWKRLPLCNDYSSGKLVSTGACSVAASYKPPMLVTRVQLPACASFVFACNYLSITACLFRHRIVKIRPPGIEPGTI